MKKDKIGGISIKANIPIQSHVLLKLSILTALRIVKGTATPQHTINTNKQAMSLV
jgi:hypothetical protein